LFRLRSGADAPSDASVQLVPGALESSNVNMAAAMTNMIALARNYDMQLKAMKAAEDNDTSSTKLLQTSS
jgi:flagellar basal-body rod protein FlgF